jgi:hypothetical protein
MLKYDNFAADGSRFFVFERFVIKISAWGTPVLTEGFFLVSSVSPGTSKDTGLNYEYYP